MAQRCAQCRRPASDPAVIGWQVVCSRCFTRVLWTGFQRR